MASQQYNVNFAGFKLYYFWLALNNGATYMGVVVRQGFWNTMSGYVGIVVGYLNMALLFPALLTPEQFGLSRVILAAGMVVAQLAQLGVVSTAVNFFPRYKDPEQKHHGFLGLVLLVPLIGLLVMGGLLLLFQDDFIEFYSSDSTLFGDYFYLLFPLIISLIYFNAVDGYLRALYKTVLPYFLKNLFLRLQWLALIGAYYLGWIDFDWLMFGIVYSHGLNALVMLLYVHRLNELHIRINWKRFGKLELGEMANYSLFAILGTSSVFLAQRLDILMLGALTDLDSVAVYSVAFFVATVIGVPLLSIANVLSALVAAAWKKQDLTEIGKLYRKVSDSQLAIALLLFLGIWCNIDSFFQLLPEEYRMGKLVVLYIALAKLFDVATGSVGLIIQYSPKYRLLLGFNVLLLVLTAATNYVLIPPYQMEGAAIATMISILLFNLAKYLYVWFQFGLQPFNVKTGAAVLAAAGTYFLSTLLPVQSNFWIDIVLRSALILALYVPVIYALRVSKELNDTMAMVAARAGIKLPGYKKGK